MAKKVEVKQKADKSQGKKDIKASTSVLATNIIMNTFFINLHDLPLVLVCDENIKTNSKELGHEDMDWINLAQDRVQWLAIVNTVMNPWVLQKVRNFLMCEHWHLKKYDSP